MSKEFARLLDEGIRTTTAREGQQIGSFSQVLADDLGVSKASLDKWRSQKNMTMPSDPETVAQLAHICVTRGHMGRAWLTSLLTQYRYPDAQTLINQLCPPQIRPIPHNLPSPKYTKFFGREDDLAKLLKFLSPTHAAPIISVDGIGGVGKTTLVLEAAEWCLRVSQNQLVDSTIPTFEAIIFATAKQQHLTAHGLLAVHQAQRTLRDIYREIAHVLDRPEITQALSDEQPQKVRDALGRQQTLLIVDNMETVEDEQEIISFLFDLPRSVKVVLTTRNQVYFYAPLRLIELPPEHGLALIEHEALSKGVTLNRADLQTLYQRTGGVPAAIIYTVGQLAAGYDLPSMLQRLANRNSDIAQFCFEGAIAPLRGQPAHQLLMALAMFPKRPLQEAVFAVAGLNNPRQALDGLVTLKRLSLVNQQDNRWSMLPLTREFALAELAVHPEFEQPARERWVQWYLDFTAKYGGDDWEEWHVHYDHIEAEWENILAVLAWCAEQERYQEIVQFWQEDRISIFTDIYNYWDDTIFWTSWIINEAKRRGDWIAVIVALIDKTGVFVSKGHRKLLLSAIGLIKELSALLQNDDYPVLIGTTPAKLFIRLKEYEMAVTWLNKAQFMLNKMSNLDENTRKRKQIAIDYRWGLFYLEMKDYDQATTCLQRVLGKSRELDWQRAIIYIENTLADIAIAQDQLNGVEAILTKGLEQAERNQDRQRTAHYQQSWARFEQKRGNLALARCWAEKALDGFDRLSMQPEYEAMKALLEQLTD